MHPGLKELLQVQELDLELATLAGRLAAFPRQIAQEDAKLEGARGVLAKTREAQTSSLKDRKKLELDVESWKERVRKYKDQTAQVKTNDAYRALLHEIETAEAEIRKAEDAVLEHMVASEEHDRQVKAAEKALAEAATTVRAAKEKIEGARAAATERQTKLRAERDRAAAGVPEELYERYRRYAPKHHGVVVSAVENEACTGCRVHLRPHVVQRLRRPENDEIVECESCGRMLYLAETPAAVAAGAPMAAASAAADPHHAPKE